MSTSSADFRACDPAVVTWKRGGRKGSVNASGPFGKRVVVQTPRFPCRVSPHAPGIMRLDMTVTADPVHAKFAEWIGGLEESASESARIDGWAPGLTLSRAVYGTNFRVMLFSDTLVFDESGSLSANSRDAKSGTLLLELVGAWTSPGRWGLRWKVAQFKFSTSPMVIVVEEDDDVGGAMEECLFD